MRVFDVHGPFTVPTYNGKAAKIVDSEALAGFWETTQLAMKRGCYVFAVRAGKGIRPVYVGRATKTFIKEVFAPHKLEKYQRCLADFHKGTPILFLLTATTSKGAPNISAIHELEEYLIQTAVSRNPHLLNVRGTKREEWAIRGVLRSGVGKPSKSAVAFKRTLAI